MASLARGRGHGTARHRDVPWLSTYAGRMSDDTTTASLRRGLEGYLRAVAGELAVPAEATSFEISDTVSAYLGLTRRWDQRPRHDLMLLWDEQHGWALAVETEPGEPTTVVGYLASEQVAPAPTVVARFVTDALTGYGTMAPRPDFPITLARNQLAGQLARYA